MSKYVITSADIEELNTYKGPNSLSDGYYKMCQALIRKSKWTIKDIQFLKQCIPDGLGELLYRLFHVKADHPLYIKYFPETRFSRARTEEEFEELRQLVIARGDGLITEEEYQERSSKIGACTVSASEFMHTNQERKEIEREVKSETHNKLALKSIAAKKDNSCLTK